MRCSSSASSASERSSAPRTRPSSRSVARTSSQRWGSASERTGIPARSTSAPVSGLRPCPCVGEDEVGLEREHDLGGVAREALDGLPRAPVRPRVRRERREARVVAGRLGQGHDALGPDQQAEEVDHAGIGGQDALRRPLEREDAAVEEAYGEREPARGGHREPPGFAGRPGRPRLRGRLRLSGAQPEERQYRHGRHGQDDRKSLHRPVTLAPELLSENESPVDGGFAPIRNAALPRGRPRVREEQP